jgi:hypothetical protein
MDIMSSVSPHLWYLFMQMLITVAIGFALMGAIKNVVAYFFVRFDKELSKNVRVVYGGQEGFIAHISMKHLIVRTEDGNENLIPIQKVNSMTWTIQRSHGHYENHSNDSDS